MERTIGISGVFHPNRPVYYRESGRTGLTAYLSGLFLLLAACVLVGFAAGLSLAWSLMYLGRVGMPQVLLAFGAPASLAYIAVRLFRRRRIRSIRLALFAAILAIPVLVHMTAVFFIATLTGMLSVQNSEWLIHVAACPMPVWEVVGSCWTKWPWVPLSLTILSGFTLILLPWSAFRITDYAECDNCRVQMRTQRSWKVPAGNPQRLVSEVENNNFEQILASISAPPESETSWAVAVEHCPTCGQFRLLSVSQTQVRRGRGENKTTSKKLIDRLILPAEWAITLTDPSSPGRAATSLG